MSNRHSIHHSNRDQTKKLSGSSAVQRKNTAADQISYGTRKSTVSSILKWATLAAELSPIAHGSWIGVGAMNLSGVCAAHSKRISTSDALSSDIERLTLDAEKVIQRHVPTWK